MFGLSEPAVEIDSSGDDNAEDTMSVEEVSGDADDAMSIETTHAG